MCNLEKRLAKCSDMAEEYNSIIVTHLEKGYVTRVQPLSECDIKWYLPHFPVIIQDRTSTKVRIVFNGTAQCDGVA